MILGIPWWVFMFILFIFISGYMAFRAMVAERRLEKQFIESQGQVYMERIEKERIQKKQPKNTEQISG
ncbi:sporulation YhaL family protein [Aquibacillus koreensis]|uniref:Sporulation YhaL family protein n=1 Tax=Aquibacillus koreensis TaxID=279446 RepID=A0A9X4AHI6_9BACI|nr:sporulation YhaL family protein [Aquibacillus koreensis]MCT2535558.1 sporulation YhaL family protein [Aquibacillus koreensis]MDC3420157.1 sporulation YhaL family protein [Aquibacillus koreensis]